MKFFITGATGFIGRHLCHRLNAAGHEIVALVRSPHKLIHLPQEGLEVLEGDLSIFQREDLEIPACDIVVHLAAELNPKSEDDYETFALVGIQQLVNCLDRQSWTPRRFLYCSSLAAAGIAPGLTPLDESHPLEPIDPYGRSKKVVEEYLHSAPFPVTIFRPPSVFGPEDPVLTLFRIANNNIGIKVGGFNQLLSFIFIDDLSEAIAIMAEEQGTHHQTYYVSFPQPVDIQSLWETIGQSLNKRLRIINIPKQALYGLAAAFSVINRFGNFKNVMSFRRYKQMTGGHFICSSEKLRKQLDWEPEFDIRKTVQATAERALANGKL